MATPKGGLVLAEAVYVRVRLGEQPFGVQAEPRGCRVEVVDGKQFPLDRFHPEPDLRARLLRYGEEDGLDRLVRRGAVYVTRELQRGEHPPLVLEQRFLLIPRDDEPDLRDPLFQTFVLSVEPAHLGLLRTGRALLDQLDRPHGVPWRVRPVPVCEAPPFLRHKLPPYVLVLKNRAPGQGGC